ncbi:MAG TPA: TolC family protein [Vicinamibacterales bacterium]|nr:TolC family protein [Vicinamibacterales bacterium]
MRTRFAAGRYVLALALTVAGTHVSVFAQVAQPPATQSKAPADNVKRLTVDDAVKLALEHNLGVQIARVDPQVQDLLIAQARANWTPAFNTTVLGSSFETPTNSFLSGGQGPSISDARVASNVGVQQLLPWGGNYSVGWDSQRSTTTNIFTNFSPQLRSSLALSFTQPLLRNFKIDSIRQQLLVSQKNREISDVDLRQTIATTTRAVRNAYWDLAYAIGSLQVQQQSLGLARESLRNNRARVEIGTMAPIDIVEAEAEVAQRQESVILAEAQIDRMQDTLRALIYDPSMPDFWTVRLEPAELPSFEPVMVDAEAAVRAALDRRTDLQQARKTLESNDISIRFFRNQTLPDISARVDYGLTGLGGTQFLRGVGFPGPVTGQLQRGFGSVLGDLFSNNFPNWTMQLNVNYPIGTSTYEVSLARARLQHTQGQTQLKNQQLQVATQVRDVTRQVQTNQKRVEATRASRQLAERRLDAEEKKFQAGMSTSFLVFQAQRDLSQARANELRAVVDYNHSIVDYETVQEAPLTGVGAGGVTTINAGAGVTTTGVPTGTTAAATQQQFQQR